MSEKEIERMKVIEMAKEKRISEKEGAQRLEISTRHFRRLKAKYVQAGAEGLISGQRGKRSNNRIKEEKREKIVDLLKSSYVGFGSTLASEKLYERDGIKVSKEMIRKILTEEGLHKPRVKKKGKAHPLRERKGNVGEMVQIDGCYHAWLENRAGKACLILYVDDASSQILAGKFVAHETFLAYAQVCREYFEEKGLPLTFYSDKFGVFRVNAKNVTTTQAITQFGRALNELGIELICANSPQAKGRVERANETLQDRLVKEMRLAGIEDYEQANAFLPQFFEVYNQKFGVQPRGKLDFHTPLSPAVDLDMIFTWRDTRIISNNLEIQFQKTVYQIVTDRPAYALKKREVLVAQHADGRITFWLNGAPLAVKVFHQQPKQAEIADTKKLQAHKPNIPAPNHPWRTFRISPKKEPLNLAP